MSWLAPSPAAIVRASSATRERAAMNQRFRGPGTDGRLHGTQDRLHIVAEDTQRQRIGKNGRVVQHLMRGGVAAGAQPPSSTWFAGLHSRYQGLAGCMSLRNPSTVRHKKNPGRDAAGRLR